MGTLLAKVHQILLVFTAGNSKPIGKDENLLPFFDLPKSLIYSSTGK